MSVFATCRSCVALLLTACLGTTTVADGADHGPAMAEARGLADALGGRLQSRLMEVMAQDGVVAAIAVCHLEAPAIATALEQEAATRLEEPGARPEVGRTALRLRNPANRPDAWERSQLQAFAERQAAGESLSGMEAVSTGKDTLRYMRAIPTGEACLACHGSALSQEVDAAIRSRYPGDAARDFEAGELRGAFTIRIPLTTP